MDQKNSDNLNPYNVWGRETKQYVIAQINKMDERIKELEKENEILEKATNDETKEKTDVDLKNESISVNDSILPNKEKTNEENDDWVQAMTIITT
jgi:hypothetical protein